MGKISLFASGLVLGGAVALAGYIAWRSYAPGRLVAESTASAVSPIEGLQKGSVSSVSSVSPAAAAVTPTPVVPGPCGFEPLLDAAGTHDEQFDLQATLANERQPDANAFLAVARETSVEGRPRDTEVALIAACRAAARASTPPSVLLSDVLARLGQHYAEAASAQPSESVKQEAMARARQLLSESVAGYTAVLGKNASKTRIAQRRVAALERAEAHPNVVTVDGSAGTQEDPARMGAASSQASQAIDENVLAGPCSNRLTAASRTACADPELAQMETDLRRLGAQAASVTRDPQGFRRRAAQAQRDASCQDKDCLMRWYAQRRRQLLDEF